MKAIGMTKSLLIISTLLASGMAMAQTEPTTAPASQPAANTLQAERVLWLPRQVLKDYVDQGRDESRLAGWARESVDRGLWRVLHFAGGQGAVTIEYVRDVPQTPSLFEAKLIVDLRQQFGESPVAKELADAIVQDMQKRLAERRRQVAEESTSLADRMEPLSRELNEVSSKMGDLQGRLAKSALPEDRPAIQQMLIKLAEQRQETGISLEVLEARRQILARQIDMLTQELKDKAHGDAIAAELQKVVEAKEANVRRIQEMIDKKIASSFELAEASGALAEAKARWLERQELVANRAGGDVLGGWNRELLNSGIDDAEKRARYKALGEQLEKLNDGLKAAQELGDLSAKAKALEDQLRPLQQEYIAFCEQERQLSKAKIEVKEQKNW